MSNTKSINSINYHDEKSGKWKRLPYSFLIALSLLINSPAQAQGNNKTLSNQNQTEIVDNSDILSNISRRTGIEIPEIYKKKLEEFFSTNKTMQNPDLLKFTEDFIVEQMKKNPGIDQKNLLIFISDCIVEKNTGKNIYDGDDGDEKRLEEFEKVFDIVEEIGKHYVKSIKEYVQKLSEMYDEQSAKSREQSAELDEKIMKEDTLRLTQVMPEFYDIYIRSPNMVKKEDIESARANTKNIINDCKKYGIDYKAVMLKGVGDKRKVEEMLKFYGVE